MKKTSNKNNLCEKWRFFMTLIFDPWVIISLIIILFLIYVSTKPELKNFELFLNLLITLTSGLLGGIIANKWSILTETKVLEVRAKSAIRSLKLILNSIGNLENRAIVFLNRLKNEIDDYDLHRNNLEEIIEKCNILEEEIMSSMEDWTDIIPEVENVKSQIGLISDLKLNVVNKQIEIDKLEQVISGKEIAVIDNLKLQEQLAQNEKQLEILKNKLLAAESKISSGLLSGITTNSGSYGTSGLSSAFLNYGTSGIADIALRGLGKRCPICGNHFFGSSLFCDNCTSSKITAVSK